MADPEPLEGEQANIGNRAWIEELQSWKAAEAVRWVGHEFDEDGFHDEEECEVCLLARAPTCKCRCGECCRRLIIQVSLSDAQREPKIAQRCSPIYTGPEFTASGQRELEGYLLNGSEGDCACVFLDQATNLCTIYETRPLTCRLFDCDGAGREQLIELGILPPRMTELK
jgi:Fe-S-cluster containining protein